MGREISVVPAFLENNDESPGHKSGCLYLVRRLVEGRLLGLMFLYVGETQNMCVALHASSFFNFKK